jgi:phage portal protein BeeE
VLKDARGHPVELFALRPERVSIVAGEDGWPAAFAYDVAGRRLTIPLLDEDAAPNVIHIRQFHPADDHYGAGCLAAADEAVATRNAASQWNRQLLENAARPSGALVYEADDGQTLTGDQFDRLKAELANAYAGAGNAGRPMLLEGGLKWQAMAMTPADMDFATLKAAAARDVALAFGGAADAARPAGRRHLRELPRGQPRALAAHPAAAGEQDPFRTLRGPRPVVPGSLSQYRPQPRAGPCRGPRAALGASQRG